MQQLTIWDVMDPEPEPEPQKGDCHTCKYMFWGHPPKGGKAVRSCSRYGGCGWEPKENCFTCANYKDVVDAYTLEHLGYKACFEYDAWSRNLNDAPEVGCEYWKEKHDTRRPETPGD